MDVVVKSISKAQFCHNVIAEWCDSRALTCHYLEGPALSGSKRRVIDFLKSSKSIKVQSLVE